MDQEIGLSVNLIWYLVLNKFEIYFTPDIFSVIIELWGVLD